MKPMKSTAVLLHTGEGAAPHAGAGDAGRRAHGWLRSSLLADADLLANAYLLGSARCSLLAWDGSFT